jgi:GNAT superfamily N-acetyltransferase
VRELGPGWATDLAILELSGSDVQDRGDHLIVSTPRNPGSHWGNCVLVTDPGAVDAVQRWMRVFETAFPSATWVAIGLPRMPSEVEAWDAAGVGVELEEVLVTSTVPVQTVISSEYLVRPLRGDDWEQSVALATAQNARGERFARRPYEAFARARMEASRELCERGVARYVGAFTEARLAAHVGIVRCGTIARYRNVLTDAVHRRRGLASHLLGVAARWDGARGCDRWVIVTEATNPAGRIYRSVGFEPVDTQIQAYRPGVD